MSRPIGAAANPKRSPASLRKGSNHPSFPSRPLPNSWAAGPHHSPYAANPPTFVKAMAPGRRGMRSTPAWVSTAARARTGSASTALPASAPNACAGQGYCATAGLHQLQGPERLPEPGRLRPLRHRGGAEPAGRQRLPLAGLVATPINAERFSTDGPNRGKSVWVRARAVFEQQVWPSLRKELLDQQAAGKVPTDQPCGKARPGARAFRRDRPHLSLG